MIVKSQECENWSFLHLEGLHPCLQSIAMVHVLFFLGASKFFRHQEKISMYRLSSSFHRGARRSIGGLVVPSGDVEPCPTARCKRWCQHWAGFILFGKSSLRCTVKSLVQQFHAE